MDESYLSQERSDLQTENERLLEETRRARIGNISIADLQPK